MDDVQWSDPDSAVLLDELLCPPEAPPMLLVLTRRSDLAKGPVAGLSRVAVRSLPLGGLGAEDACRLVEVLGERLAQRPDPVALSREAGGHPLFIHELVRHAPAAGSAVSLAEALGARVAQLDAEPARLLNVLAVAGAPLPLSVCARAAGLSPDASQKCVSLLRVALLLRQSGARADEAIEPYHDRIRHAVVTRLDETALREVHSALAGALVDEAPGAQSPRLLVLHLQAAGDRERAATYAETVARQATEALAFDQAAEFYRLALDLGTYREPERRTLQAQLGEALKNAGRCAEAAETFLLCADGAGAAARLEYQRKAAEQLLIGGYVDRGLGILNSVLSEVGLALPASPRRALFEILWCRARLRLRGLSWVERDASQIAPRDLEQLELHKAVTVGLSLVDSFRGQVFCARGLLLALHSGERLHLARSLALESMFRGTRGRRQRPRVASLLAKCRRIAEVSGAPYLRACSVGGEGVSDYLAGFFLRAQDNMEQAEEIWTHECVGTIWELNNLRVLLLLLLLRTGQLRVLRTRLYRYLRDGERRGDRFVITTLNRGFHFSWLVDDDLPGAHEVLDQTYWSPPETGFLHLQNWYETKAQVELALYENAGTGQGPERGELESLSHKVESVRHSLLGRVQIIRADVHCLAGRLALAHAEAGSLAALRRAKRHARRLLSERVPYSTVWALLLQAGIAAKEEDPALAIRLLDQAITLADPEGLALHAACARRRLAALKGDAALLAASDLYMQAEGVKNPERLTAVVAPGFARP